MFKDLLRMLLDLSFLPLSHLKSTNGGCDRAFVLGRSVDYLSLRLYKQKKAHQPDQYKIGHQVKRGNGNFRLHAEHEKINTPLEGVLFGLISAVLLPASSAATKDPDWVRGIQRGDSGLEPGVDRSFILNSLAGLLVL